MTIDLSVEALQVLQDQLASPSPMLRLRSAEALQRHAGFLAEEVLRELLDSPRADIRRRASVTLLRGAPKERKGSARYANGETIPPDARSYTMKLDPASGVVTCDGEQVAVIDPAGLA